jgi:hypothetical protein
MTRRHTHAVATARISNDPSEAGANLYESVPFEIKYVRPIDMRWTVVGSNLGTRLNHLQFERRWHWYQMSHTNTARPDIPASATT